VPSEAKCELSTEWARREDGQCTCEGGVRLEVRFVCSWSG
jgi:hypothetical protein